MKPFRLAFFLTGAAALTAGLSACLREPSYSTTPEIGFNNIQLIRILPKIRGGVTADSIRVTVDYQDGDGDLGLTPKEREAPPFGFLNPDKTPNKFYFNYFIEPFVLNRTTKKFESLAALGLVRAGGYNGAYPRPTTLTDAKGAPIRGTLTYGLPSFDVGGLVKPGQAIRFEVSIADRALHVSNTIVTDTVRIAPR